MEIDISENLPFLPELCKNVVEGVVHHHGKLESSEGIAYHRPLTSNLRLVVSGVTLDSSFSF